jgi:glycosyltransferase involved in cell wall biosynthesis
MIPLVVCTAGSPHLSRLMETVDEYASDQVEVWIFNGTHGNFGDAYNHAMREVFECYDEILIANDDIALTEHSIKRLMDDVKALKRNVPRLGLVAAQSDNVRDVQKDTLRSHPVEAYAVSPILAWISKEAFEAAPFPPINWYSDDVQCADLRALGYQHFVSRAFVFHVGSSTIGHDTQRHVDEARPWIVKNRPQYAVEWGLIERPPLKIAVYAISKNEAQFVERFCNSAKDADLILIADTGSTDDTAELAAKHGAIVHSIHIKPWRFDLARNAALALVPADIDVCISLDLDEVLEPGWREEIERLWKPETTNLWYMFDWGSGLKFPHHKIHSRAGYHWHHPCHEEIRIDPRMQPVAAHSDMLLVSHYPDSTKSRGQYMEILEAAVKEDASDPSHYFYFARELTFCRRWTEAREALIHYLGMNAGSNQNERSYAMRLLGQTHEELNDQDGAQRWYLQAASEAPNTREPWCNLAMLMYRQSRWHECYMYAHRALLITVRSLVYTGDPAVWGYYAHDLVAIAAWNMGLKDEARKQAKLALEHAPDDERLNANLAFMENEDVCSTDTGASPDPGRHVEEVFP